MHITEYISQLITADKGSFLNYLQCVSSVHAELFFHALYTYMYISIYAGRWHQIKNELSSVGCYSVATREETPTYGRVREYESTRVRSRLLSDINTSRRVLFVLHDSIAIFIYYRKTFRMFQPLVVVERPQNKLIPVITDVVPQPESLLLLLLLFFIFFFSSSSSVSPEDKEKMQLFMLLRTRKAQTLVTWKKVKQTWCCCLFVFFPAGVCARQSGEMRCLNGI